MWSTLHHELKLLILSYLTIEELAEVMLVDRLTCQLAAEVRRRKLDAINCCENPELFLSPHAVKWALGNDRCFQVWAPGLTVVPDQVSSGRKIGSGGTNSVFLVQEHPGFVIKDAGAKSGLSREYEALVRMGAIGLKTVLRDLRFSDGKIRIVMDRINGCMDSKTIVGYQKQLKDYIDPAAETPVPNLSYAVYIKGETIQQLLFAWEQMVCHKQFFSDFQFLLDPSGEVLMNDPTGILAKDSGTTKVVIQAIIDTYEYLFHKAGRGRSWKEFKQYKKALRQQRAWEFGAICKCKFIHPDFCVIDYRFCRFEDPTFSTLFILDHPIPPNDQFVQVGLPDGRYGYYHASCSVARLTWFDLSSWQ